MSGYTPVFDTVFNGTMCGRWPELPVWLTLLPLADKNGHIDMTPQAIAVRTGWPIDLLERGISELCQPDPDSRTREFEGRRLVLIDPERSWGWVVVNHEKYREKARKQMQQIEATQSGRDAERKRIERERQRAASSDVQRSPAPSSADRLSDADADADADADSEKISPLTLPQDPNASGARNTLAPTHKGANSSNKTGTRVPIPFPVSTAMQTWAEKETPTLDVTAATNEFIDYWKAVPGPRGRKLDWIATWRNRMREVHARARVMGHRGAPSKPSPTTEELELRERNNADR